MHRPRAYLWWSWARRLFQPVKGLLFPEWERLTSGSTRFNPLALQRCEERNPPGSFLSWLTAFALADDLPAVVNPPPPAPTHYHEQLEASQSAAVTDWTEPPADAQAASVVSAEPDTAALDFAFTFPPPRAAELPDDHSQAALGSGGIPSSPAPPSNQLATGGGTACSTAPAPPSFANAT